MRAAVYGKDRLCVGGLWRFGLCFVLDTLVAVEFFAGFWVDVAFAAVRIAGNSDLGAKWFEEGCKEFGVGRGGFTQLKHGGDDNFADRVVESIALRGNGREFHWTPVFVIEFDPKLLVERAQVLHVTLQTQRLHVSIKITFESLEKGVNDSQLDIEFDFGNGAKTGWKKLFLNGRGGEDDRILGFSHSIGFQTFIECLEATVELAVDFNRIPASAAVLGTREHPP